MSIGTSDGKYYEDETEYLHDKMFGEPEPEEEPKNGLFLVRHGDTAANDEDIVHGWTNHSLNDKGIEQAHQAAESLKDKEITRIISSDLPRAKQTANIIAKKLGVPVQFDPRLRTWDAGDFDGTHDHKEFEKYTQQVKDQKPLPEIKIPEELNKPNYGPGRMFGNKIDHMQKEYGRLGIKPGDHFMLEGEEYMRLPLNMDTDWDFMKVPTPDPNVPQAGEFEKYTTSVADKFHTSPDYKNDIKPLTLMGRSINPFGSDKEVGNDEMAKEWDAEKSKNLANQIRRNKRFNMEDMPLSFPDLSPFSQKDI